jgi:hypothetical protein
MLCHNSTHVTLGRWDHLVLVSLQQYDLTSLTSQAVVQLRILFLNSQT